MFASDDDTWNECIRVWKPLPVQIPSASKLKKEQVIMEEEQKKEKGSNTSEPRQHQPPYISQMQPVTHEAYGGGLYGRDDDEIQKDAKTVERDAKNIEKEPQQHNRPASETHSADGPDEAKTTKPKHKPPQSSGDRDIDVTGQSYIQ